MTVRFQRPQLPPVAEIERYFARAEEARWFSNFGPCHELLIERVADRTAAGVHSVPVVNCTLGLMLALAALLEDRRGDEVLVPSFTFPATAAAITWTGRTPVFVDVREDCWMLDEGALQEALEQRAGRIAGVLAVTTFGVAPPASLASAWERACEAAGVPLLVDSAPGYGSRMADGTPLSALGDAEVFSWHATKPFGIGEGGLVCTRDERLAGRVARLANFGFEGGVVSSAPGINAKLPEWSCATALAVDDRFDEILAARRRCGEEIERRVMAATGMAAQRRAGGATWQFVPVLARDTAQRDRVRAQASARGVELRAYFERPLHEMGAFAGFPRAGTLTVSERLARRVLSLPMANDLSDEEIDAIVVAVAGEEDRTRS